MLPSRKLNWKMTCCLCAGVVIGLAASSTALSDVIEVVPVDAQAETQDGVAWTINAASSSLNCARFTGIPLQRRGLMEFPLAGIPQGSTITSVALRYSVNSFTSGSGAPAVMEFHLYSGNGLLAASDAEASFALGAVSEPVTALTTYTAMLSPAAVEAVHAAASHLGVRTYQQTLGRQASMWSSEIAASSPRLTVTFTPPSVDERSVFPTADAEASRSGGGPWALDEAGTLLVAANYTLISESYRPLLAFSLPGFTPGTRVVSARLSVSVALLTQPPDPILEIHGHRGDRMLTIADADRSPNLLGDSGAIGGLGRRAIFLDPAALELLLRQSALLEFSVRPRFENSQTGFYSSEWAVGTDWPELTIGYRAPACDADWNGSGQVTVEDLFGFLAAYFAGDPQADVTRTGGVAVGDIFAFLVDYFEPCP